MPEDKLVLALGLTTESGAENSNTYLEQILNQVYPGVWDADTRRKSKLADPIKIESQTGAKPVIKKQYPFRLEDRKGVEPIISKFLASGLLKECESEFNTPILPVKKPNRTYRLVQDL